MLWLLLVLLLGLALFSWRFAWWRRRVDYRYPRILMYHMVAEPRRGARFNKLRVPPRRFEAQLRWLREDGWTFLRMSQLLESADLPEKTVVLTFDDGYEDNLRNADPLLERYGACATLYLVEDRFDRDWSSSKKAHHDSGELMHESKLSDEQVRSLLDSGRWELGGHTRTHANLPRLADAERRREIADARMSLAETFSTPVASFAYPFGLYEPRDVELVREAGFASAVTTNEGIARNISAQAHELPRVKISGKEGLLAFRQRLRCGRRGG